MGSFCCKNFLVGILKSCFWTYFLLDTKTTFLDAHPVDGNEVEAKLNRILEKEVQESDLLRTYIRDKDEKLARENIKILDQLMETSGRMEWLVTVLSDLKTLLLSAIDSQEKHSELQAEVFGLKEEIKYLSQEIQEMKSDRAKSDSFQLNSKLQSKSDNDEKKISWLTSGLEEIRHEVRDLSSSLNVTTLLQLSQEERNEVELSKRNMDTFQKELEKMQVAQIQTAEDVLELRVDIADVRTSQTRLEMNPIQSEYSLSRNSDAHPPSSFQQKLRQILQNSEKDRGRHRNKKTRDELNLIEEAVIDLIRSKTQMEPRLGNLEMVLKPNLAPTSQTEAILSSPNEANELRLSNIESSLAEVQAQVGTWKADSESVKQLQESTQTLFKVLEALEAKYDGRTSQFQSSLTIVEVTCNALSRKQEEFKGTQNFQSKILKNLETEVDTVKKQLEKANLRLATLKTQILTWGTKTCVDELKEKAQDLRISTLEAKLIGNISKLL